MSNSKAPGNPSAATKDAADTLVDGLGDLLRAQLAGMHAFFAT